MRGFGRDESAVEEVVGFILMFALSSVVLVFSMQTFSASQENSNNLVAAMELRNVANRISARVVQAGIVSQEFPQAEYKVHIRIPEEIAGFRYTVQFRDRDNKLPLTDPNAEPIVYAQTVGDSISTQGQDITGESSIFRVDEVNVNGLPIVLGANKVFSNAGYVTVHYWYESDMTQGSQKWAHEGHLDIKEGTT